MFGCAVFASHSTSPFVLQLNAGDGHTQCAYHTWSIIGVPWFAGIARSLDNAPHT